MDLESAEAMDSARGSEREKDLDSALGMDSVRDSEMEKDLDSATGLGEGEGEGDGLGEGVGHRFGPSGVGTNCPYVFVFLCPPLPFGHL